MKKLFQNHVVEVVAVNGGWTTVKFNDHSTRKVRNGSLTEIPKETKMTQPERIDRIAKIGNTEVNLNRYIVSDQKTASGRRAIDVNDEVATLLRGASLDVVYTTAADQLNVPEQSLRDQYSHLNPGMQRMNLGNRIRGAEKARELAEAKAEKDAIKAAAKAEKDAIKAAAKAEKDAEKARRNEERIAKLHARRQAEEAARAARRAAKAE